MAPMLFADLGDNAPERYVKCRWHGFAGKLVKQNAGKQSAQSASAKGRKPNSVVSCAMDSGKSSNAPAL